MIKIKDSIYRNLEEQVQYLTDYHAVNQGLAQWGIRVIDEVETEEELNAIDTSTLEYGDAVAVGTEAPFFFYIWTRASIEGGADYWFPFGEISIVGPEGARGERGEKGDTGERGSLWFSSTQLPNAYGSYKEEDQWLHTPSGNVYQYNQNNEWILISSIRGPQGIRGSVGPAPEIGNNGSYITSTDPETGVTTNVISLESLKGEKGDTGDVGGFINIAGVVANTNQLPTPSSLQNLTVAYLVGAAEPYTLYIQVGSTSADAIWTDVGPLNVATLVTVNGAYQNVWNADTKLDKITSVTTHAKVYAKAADGGQGYIDVSKAVVGNAIVQRANTGSIILASTTPQEPYAAVSKKYVDDAIAQAGGGGGGGSSVQFYQHRFSNLTDTNYEYVDIISTISESFGKGASGYLSTVSSPKWYHMSCKGTTGDYHLVVGWVGPPNEAAVMYEGYTGGHTAIDMGLDFQETVTEYTL